MSQSTLAERRRQSQIRRENLPQKYKYRLGECGDITTEQDFCHNCKNNTLVRYEDGTKMCSDCGWPSQRP